MSYSAQIEALYVEYFNRPADVAGLDYWNSVLTANGGNTAVVSAAFATSSEYTTAYAGLTPYQIVNQVYQNLFGHAADPAGLVYWGDILTASNNGVTVSNIVAAIAAGAQGTDATAFANKVTAAGDFTGALVTTPEIVGYSAGGAANTAASQYLNSVVANPTNATGAALTTVLASDLAAATSASGLAAAVASVLGGSTAPGSTVSLTIGTGPGGSNILNYSSSAPNTTFSAQLNNNSNTFISGDVLTATGTGNVLNADLGNAANFAILATTTGIQTVNITAEAQNISSQGSASNNVSQLPVEINALRMSNVTNWTDVQSRADVVVENIQLPNGNTSTDLTSAVTFTMRDTQPGSISGTANGSSQGGSTNAASIGPSFRAYFDPQALKAGATAASATVDIDMINTGATYQSANPLSANVANGFTILNGTTPVNFTFTAADIAAIKAATLANNQTVVDTAIIDAVAAYNTANGTHYTATPSSTLFKPVNSVTAAIETGSPMTIALAGATLGVGNWPTSSGFFPGNYSITNYQAPTPVAGSQSLITSNLIVDNVGQGGYPQLATYSGSTEGAGGDVIIGSMATSGGVQQINIDVQRTSWNDSVQTTNNVLQVVNIVSDAALSPTVGGQGYAIGAEATFGSTNMIDYAAPGVFVTTHGLHDVQTINATGFNGSLEIGEMIDYSAFARYLQGANAIVPFSITLGNDTNGVINPGMTAAFNSVNLAIDSAVAGSGNFTETITGGTGNDMIQLSILNQQTQGGFAADTVLANNGQWVANMTQLDSTSALVNNVTIDLTAGGNNTVIFNGAGAALIKGGTGNDSYYIDNTAVTPVDGPGVGTKAVFVANATQNTTITTAVPTAVETIPGTAGVYGQNVISWVNIPSPAGPATNVEDVAVNAPIAGVLDIQGIEVSYSQAAAGTALATTTIAADVLAAYKDYVLNGGNPVLPTLPTETTVATNGGGVIGWETAAGGPVIVKAATDVMTETFTISAGNTVTITVGNEYGVSQTALQATQGVDTFTRTVTGATSWSLSGQNPVGTTNTGDAPQQSGTVSGSAQATEQQTVTWTGLLGKGSPSESIGGITVTDTDATGLVQFTPAQVAAAVQAGNGTYGSLTVAGVGTPAATGWTPATNPYTALAVAGSETVNGNTITNNTALPLTAAQVATDVALADVGKVTTGVAVSGLAAGLVTLTSETYNGITVSNGPAGSLSAATVLTDVGASATGLNFFGIVTVNNPYTALAAGGTETVVGVTVINNTGAALGSGQVAADVFNFTSGVLTTGVAISGATGYGTSLLAYGTPNAAYSGANPLIGSATNGTQATNLNTTVSLDSYGNLTTNAAAQGGASLHTFTGVGEQVTVTFEGVSAKAAIMTTSADAAGTYTTTDVNNAILTAVNGDPMLSKLLHATEGSASGSVILSSLIDGIHNVNANGSPLIAFSAATGSTVVTGTSGGSYTAAMAAADSLALSQIGIVQQAVGDGVTTQATSLVGGDSTYVNNSNIIDAGGNNVIDLSSNSGNALNIGNLVTLSGTGNDVITNYKVGLDIITISSPTVNLVLNAVNDTFQAAYTGGVLNVTASWLSDVVAKTGGIDFGTSTSGTFTHTGATTGAGIVVIEAAGSTSIYETTNVAAPTFGTGGNTILEATVVGVSPALASIHLV